jgi:TATA-box binding protein (TBP) (component of TFIID and TFIIIB)
MTAVFQLWNSKCGSPFPGWYRHLATKGINSEYNPSRFHAIIQRVRTDSKCNAAQCSCNKTTYHHGRQQKQKRSVTALIYRTGNVCLIGGHTEAECLEAAQKIVRRANFSIYVNKPASTTISSTTTRKKERNKAKNSYSIDWFHVFAFRVCNRAATFQIVGMHSILSLDMLAERLKNSMAEEEAENVQVIYQPEHFNGLRLKLQRYCHVQVSTQINKNQIPPIQQQQQQEKPSALIFSNGKVILTGFNMEKSMIEFAKRIYFITMS